MSDAFAIEDYELGLDDDDDEKDFTEAASADELNLILFREHIVRELCRGLRIGNEHLVLVVKQNGILSASQMSIALDDLEYELRELSLSFDVTAGAQSNCDERRIRFTFRDLPAHVLGVLGHKDLQELGAQQWRVFRKVVFVENVGKFRYLHCDPVVQK